MNYPLKILKKKLFWFIILFALFVWINNSSLFVDREKLKPGLVAHRGLSQTFDLKGVQWNTNTAEIIHKPEHPYMENTIPSMKAAFAYHANIVELDVRLTKDKRLAVFHDYLLEYRTEGKGNVSDHTLQYLKTLDVGYGYTADKGKTFPMRGTGIGLLPSIDEVFDEFPDKELLIHVKDGGEEAGKRLCGYFEKMTINRREQISVYGNKAAILYIREKFPDMKVLTKSLLIKGLLMYELVGWTGYVPEAIKNMHIVLPLSYTKILWGWPDRFLQRMESANSRVVLVFKNNGFSQSFNNEEELSKLPENYSGYIRTDRIDKIGPYYSSKLKDTCASRLNICGN